jgi:H+/gluconate symporter-like permease
MHEFHHDHPLSIDLLLHTAATMLMVRKCTGGSTVASLVALPPVRDLLLSAKHLFVAAMVAIAAAGGLKDEPWHRFSPEF